MCKKERLELEPGYAAHLYESYMYSVLVLVMLSFRKMKNKFLPANQSTVHVQLDYIFQPQEIAGGGGNMYEATWYTH